MTYTVSGGALNSAQPQPSDDMGRAVARSDQKINRQLPLVSVRINAKGGH